jgi:hypothetical protein
MAEANITSTASTTPPHALFEQFSGRATQIIGCMPDNSMSPKFQEGDLLQIEPCEQITTGGTAYAFEFDGEQFIRLLMLCPGGDISVSYADPLFSSYRIAADQLHRFKMIGRVVGVLQYRSVI